MLLHLLRVDAVNHRAAPCLGLEEREVHDVLRLAGDAVAACVQLESPDAEKGSSPACGKSTPFHQALTFLTRAVSSILCCPALADPLHLPWSWTKALFAKKNPPA